ncbi:class I SAM-dependent methyltransferase [Endozoicomonadaceae bacterium StTr2]
MKYCGDIPELYSELAKGDISHLFLRDVPGLLRQYAGPGNKALDYGCGTGLRMPFLEKLGFDVEGMDVEPEMLHQCRQNHPEFTATRIQSASIPRPDNSYDLVFICYVLLIIPSLAEILQIMEEVNRVLKPGGKVFIITASEDAYDSSRQWLFDAETITVVQPPLVSGSKTLVRFPGTELELVDYFWTDQDYRGVFAAAGFQTEVCHRPLGRDGEGFEWKDEKQVSPSVLYILKKYNHAASEDNTGN